jgi:hypothetical protein
VRSLVRSPAIGEALYRVNIHPGVINMMYRRHVYANAELVTPQFVAAKRAFARQPGARFASVAFVTGALDPLPDRQSFLTLLTPPPAPTLILCGTSTPPKSKAEMAAIAASPDVVAKWMPGSLGLHEEFAEAISEPIASFVGA